MCMKILAEEHGKTFPKAYYKKAYILSALSRYEEAMYDFYLLRKTVKEGLRCLQENPSSSIRKQDFLKIISEIDGKAKDQKAIYRNMFRDEDEEELLPETSSKTTSK